MPIANPAAITVSAAAVLLAAANPNRTRLIITQTTANAIRLGNNGVTATTGWRLGQNERYELNGLYGPCPTDAIYGIAEGADGSATVVEFTNG